MWVVGAESKFGEIGVYGIHPTTDGGTADEDVGARHLQVFMTAATGLIVCRTPRRFKVSDKVTAVPWTEIVEAVAGLAQ